MSTTFEIYPTCTLLPTFKEVRELILNRLDHVWERYGLNHRPVLEITLINSETNDRTKPELSLPAKWEENHYLWISFEGIGGGTDGYFRNVDELSIEIWEEEKEITKDKNDDYYQRVSNITDALKIGYYWSFRRSAGQSAIVSLTYGLVASALAELTNGYIWSDDGGWDYQRFPATYNEFDQWFMNPNMALSEDKREWAEWCINTLKDLYK